MALSKIIGWLTFFIGIIIVGSTIYLTYNIFTGESAVPQLFEFSLNLESPTQAEDPGLQGQIERMLSEQLKNLIPTESLTKFANLTIWTVGAWLLVFGGSKVAELGIKLISIPVTKES